MGVTLRSLRDFCVPFTLKKQCTLQRYFDRIVTCTRDSLQEEKVYDVIEYTVIVKDIMY